MNDEHFERQFAALTDALWQRHSESLTFQELRRGLQALSVQYTQKRKLQAGKALSQHRMGRGKQAAFALSFAPRHLLMVRHIGHSLRHAGALPQKKPTIVDLGCGSGVGSAGLALAWGGPPWPELAGFDTSRTALVEARWLWQQLGLVGSLRAVSFNQPVWRSHPGALLLAAWAVNELSEDEQMTCLQHLLKAHSIGHPILIVEPIARGISPFWLAWSKAFVERGGRADTWRHRAELPGQLGLLSRAAGLDHRELTAKSLWLPAPP